jgi:hypothetical protein
MVVGVLVAPQHSRRRWSTDSRIPTARVRSGTLCRAVERCAWQSDQTCFFFHKARRGKSREEAEIEGNLTIDVYSWCQPLITRASVTLSAS